MRRVPDGHARAQREFSEVHQRPSRLAPREGATQAAEFAQLARHTRRDAPALCPQYYLDTQVLPSLMREHKLHAAWAAAGKRYHDTIYKFNYTYDRDLRYSAVTKNQVLSHINHTEPKTLGEHVEKMVAANKKIYDAFTPGSKRLLIWQSKTSLV